MLEGVSFRDCGKQLVLFMRRDSHNSCCKSVTRHASLASSCDSFLSHYWDMSYSWGRTEAGWTFPGLAQKPVLLIGDDSWCRRLVFCRLPRCFKIFCLAHEARILVQNSPNRSRWRTSFHPKSQMVPCQAPPCTR